MAARLHNREITRLIDRTASLKSELKDCNNELKTALAETEMYKEVLEATLNQANVKCKVPEKVAIAHALKVTLVSYQGEEEETEN